MGAISSNENCTSRTGRTFDRILGKLGDFTTSGSEFISRCPAHDDREASLSIKEGDDGRVLLHCFAGCTVEQIVNELGLTPADLFEKNDKQEKGRIRQGDVGCTLEKYATVKQLPTAFLKGLGCSEIVYMNAPAVRIPYRDSGGQEVAVQFRVALSKSGLGDNRFRWKKGDKPRLYGLDRLNPQPTFTVLVEGASDCHTLWLHHIPALGLPGAGNWNEDRDAKHLDGISIIYVIIEPDKGGETVKQWLSLLKIRDRVRLVSLGEYKDPSDLYLSDPEHFPVRFQAALDAALPWTEQATAEAVTQRNEAWQQCRDLATLPCILDCFSSDLERSGVAGEQRLAQLIYLAVVSRLLSRLISLALKGPSSGGKSYLTECVLSFFPDSTYYALSAMSERALAYSEEPLQHRMLVIYEAAGMQGDFCTYLLRSLLSEGRVRYETVEKTREGLQAKLIEREGPTGLIVTTTAIKLHPENETRLLSLTVTDTPEQTRDVLDTLATEEVQDIDRGPWYALQTWLEHGEHRVTIPYGKVLARLIPPVAVRLRRDCGAILALIRTHAILHQATREKDDQGCIIATIVDYVVIRELVHDLIAEGVEARVPATVCETVEAVRKILMTGVEDVSVGRLAQELKIDKAAASRRVHAAGDRGFLKNLETKRGHPARWVLNDSLPEER